MASSASATAVALLFAYIIYYALHLLNVFGKGSYKAEELQERSKKMYLFGIIALLSIHFVSTYAAVFAWLTFIALGAYYFTLFVADEEKRKKLFTLTGLAYMGLLTVWWIGETVVIFSIDT